MLKPKLLLLCILSLLYSIPMLKGCCFSTQPTTTVSAGIDGPFDIAFSADGSCLGVTNSANGTVAIYPTIDGCSVGTPQVLTGFDQPAGIAFSPSGSCVVIGQFGAGEVSIYPLSGCTIDPTPSATIPNINLPEGIAFSPDGTCLAIAAFGESVVYIYTLGPDCSSPTLATTISTNISFPSGVEFSPDGSCLWVTNFGDGTNGTITVYSASSDCTTFTLLNTYPGFVGPGDIAISSDGLCAAITDFTAQTTSIYNLTAGCDLGLIRVTYPTPGDRPIGVSFSPQGNCFALATFDSDTFRLYGSTTAQDSIVSSCANTLYTGQLLPAGQSLYELVTPPLNGVVSIQSTTGVFTYIPNTDFVGGDSFRFNVEDLNGCNSQAVVTIIVHPLPTAFASSGITCSNWPVMSTVTATAVVPATIVNYIISANPEHGSVIIDAQGMYTYMPEENFSGADSFSFSAIDSNGCMSLPAVVSITINPLPLATLTASESMVLPGVPVTLTVSISRGTAPYRLLWSDGFLQQSDTTTIQRIVTPQLTTSYGLTIIDGNGCQSPFIGPVTVFASSSLLSDLTRAIITKDCMN